VDVTINNTVYNNYSRQIGDIFEYPSLAPAPPGALLCDGMIASRAVYADLFSIIGTTYGSGLGDGLTFNLPNLLSSDSSLVYYIQATLAGGQAVSTAGFVVRFTLASSASLTKTYLLQVCTAEGASLNGEFAVRLWFVDSATVLTPPSAVPPDTPGTNEFTIVTNTNGQYSLVLEHSEARDWWLCASVAGSISKQEIRLEA
jgi:microcystin-dependent protein